MTKNMFDTRSIAEIVSNLVSERTDQGDSIKLIISYKGEDKPQLVLRFSSYDVIKKALGTEEEISDWLPEHPWEELIERGDDGRVQKTRSGPSTWPEFITSGMGLGIMIQKIIETGGRNFSYEEK